VYEATLPLFSEYGRLVTGLHKINLTAPATTTTTTTDPSAFDPAEDTTDNPGVYTLKHVAKINRSRRRLAFQGGPLGTRPGAGAEDGDDDDEEDPVWEACRVLDQLERLERQARAFTKLPSSTLSSADPVLFGRIPSVPWLDALSKARAEAVLRDLFASQEVRTT
jgi:hypothetical protein